MTGGQDDVKAQRRTESLRRHHHRRGPDRPRALQDAALHVLQRHLRGRDGRAACPLPNVVVKLAERQAEQHLRQRRRRVLVRDDVPRHRDPGRQGPQRPELGHDGQQLRPDPRHEHRLRLAARRQVRRRRHVRPRRRTTRSIGRPATGSTLTPSRGRQRASSTTTAGYDGALLRWIARSSVPRYGRDDERVVAHLVRGAFARSPRPASMQ